MPGTNNTPSLRLNLGCGTNKIDGFVNVDKFAQCSPDIVHDLEQFPWPWPTSAVSEIVLVHVLEHIGQTTDIFLSFMKELYRVCADGAKIYVAVPHPHHRDFVNDPTHVRPITPALLDLFSQKRNSEFERDRAANSPLARYTGTDFEITGAKTVLDDKWKQKLDRGVLTKEQVHDAIDEKLNVVREYHISLRVIKSSSAS